jgi:hypothetical protein
MAIHSRRARAFITQGNVSPRGFLQQSRERIRGNATATTPEERGKAESVTAAGGGPNAVAIVDDPKAQVQMV